MIADVAPPPALAAAPVAIAFAPPAGPVRYRVTHTHPGPGGALHTGVEQTLRFARTGTAWRATLTMTGLFTDAPPPIAASMRAGLEPFLGVPITVEVDGDGRVGAVVDGAATWAKVAASYRAVGASLEARGIAPPARAALLAALDRAAGIDRGAQDARLRESVADLIQASLPRLPVTASAGWTADRQAPDGTRIARQGRIVLVAADAGSASYRVQLEGASAERTTIRVSRHTGLLLERRIARTLPVNGRPVELVEDIRQTP